MEPLSALADSRELKAILFDLDDTIVAWDAVAEQSWQKVCLRFAPRIKGLEAEKLYATIKEVREWYLSDKERHRLSRLNLVRYRREMVSASFTRLGIAVPELANELADSYGIEREAAVFVLPGAIDTLKRFRNGSLRVALVTNGTSQVQRRKLERFGLSHLFDYVIIEEEFGFGKPDERVFLHTLEKLKVTAAETWMVGDDLERDIAGAQKVGIFGIWVDWRGAGLPESAPVRPDKIINNLSELR